MGPLVLLLTAAAATPYDQARAELEHKREDFASALKNAENERARNEILDRASSELFQKITQELLPAWAGTPWAFSGTSNTPQEGEIACGMFVGTILEHAGFRLDRIALGRLASEQIALTLTTEKNLRRYRLKPVEEVEEDVEAWGEGLYMVGLDFHAAFIVVDASGRASLVHSSYYLPRTVRAEPLQGTNPFADSKYRVIAKLLDREMTRRWVLRSSFSR